MSLTPAARLCWWSESRHRLILRASRRPVRRRWRGRSTAPRWARVPPPCEAAVTAAVAAAITAAATWIRDHRHCRSPGRRHAAPPLVPPFPNPLWIVFASMHVLRTAPWPSLISGQVPASQPPHLPLLPREC